MAFAHLSKWHLQKGWGPDRLNGSGSQQEKRAKVTMGITGWILMQFTQRDRPSRGAAKTYQRKTLSIDIDCASVFDIHGASASSKQHGRRIIFSFVKSFHLSLLALIRSVWFNRHLWRIMVKLTRHSVGEQSRNHTELDSCNACWPGTDRFQMNCEIISSNSSVKQTNLAKQPKRVPLIRHHNSSLNSFQNHIHWHHTAIHYWQERSLKMESNHCVGF